jgi:hypothetical protein
MSAIKRMSAVAASLLVLAGCDRAPTAPTAAITSPAARASVAERDPIDSEGPLIFFAFLPCGNGGQGEFVRVAGRIRHQGHRLVSGGREHVSIRTTLDATGTGLTTDAVYAVSGREREMFNARRVDEVFASGTARWWSTLRFTDEASGVTFRLEWLSRFVVTPRGEYVVDRMEERAYCE